MGAGQWCITRGMYVVFLPPYVTVCDKPYSVKDSGSAVKAWHIFLDKDRFLYDVWRYCVSYGCVLKQTFVH